MFYHKINENLLCVQTSLIIKGLILIHRLIGVNEHTFLHRI